MPNRHLLTVPEKSPVLARLSAINAEKTCTSAGRGKSLLAQNATQRRFTVSAQLRWCAVKTKNNKESAMLIGRRQPCTIKMNLRPQSMTWCNRGAAYSLLMKAHLQ